MFELLGTVTGAQILLDELKIEGSTIGILGGEAYTFVDIGGNFQKIRISGL